jgi:hypothetical protein
MPSYDFFLPEGLAEFAEAITIMSVNKPGHIAVLSSHHESHRHLRRIAISVMFMIPSM